MWLVWTYLGVLVGVGLVALGRRGRRVDNHRLCRCCRYDLFGSIGSAHCPECGTDLCIPGAPRPRGNRRSRPRMILTGMFVVVPCLAFGGAGTYLEATGWNYIHHIPQSMVVYEAKWASGPVQSRAFAELNRRMKGNPACRQELVTLALDVQGDRSMAWDRRWGDIVEKAFEDGVTTSVQWDRYVRQAIPIKVRIGPCVRLGAPVTIESLCDAIRGASRLFHCELEVSLVGPAESHRVAAEGWMDSGFATWEKGESMIFPADVLQGLPAGTQPLTLKVEGYIIAKGTTIEVHLQQDVPVNVLPADGVVPSTPRP